MSTRGCKPCPGCCRTISGNAVACRDCSGKTGGCLEILNVQGGDVKIKFDRDNPADTIRAKRIVTDMLRRGYALIVEVERHGERAYERVQEFDEARGEYIVADFDSFEAAKSDVKAVEEAAPVVEAEVKRRGRPRTTALSMETTKATAVGRSAGG